MESLAALVIGFLVFALFGFLVYLIVTYIPQVEPFKQVLIVVAVVFAILYLLALLTGQATLPTPQFFHR